MPIMNDTQIRALIAEEPDWKLEDGKLVRDWSFKDFVAAMVFVNKVAALAEGVGHHPGHRYPLQQSPVGAECRTTLAA